MINVLPVAQYPQITPPTVMVSMNYPGANAETVEKSIATIVEPEVNGAKNMLYFSSSSAGDGSYSLKCTFEVGTNLDMASVDINNRVNKAVSKHPKWRCRHFVHRGVSGRSASSACTLGPPLR